MTEDHRREIILGILELAEELDSLAFDIDFPEIGGKISIDIKNGNKEREVEK